MAFNPLNRKLDRNGNPIVSKAELEDFKSKYGQKMELRDFLNKERGLKRRDGAGIKTSAPAPVLNSDSLKTDEPATATAKDVAGLRSPAASPSDSSREVTAKELADRMSPAKESVDKPSRIRAATTSDTSDFMPGGMKKGGKVSSASSRADGCATKGKTRGRMI